MDGYYGVFTRHRNKRRGRSVSLPVGRTRPFVITMLNNPFRTSHRQRLIACVVACALLLTSAVATTGQEKPRTPDDAVDWVQAQKFWSFQKPKRHAPPAVKTINWPHMPVDFFVLHQMERKGLSPSPEADRRTLIRRVTLDLTGLPPTPEELDAFLHDNRHGAYDRVVDRLIGSPRFGERMASTWLPLARYAEDQAHQVGDDTKFFYPNAYKYRDWVIAAFNRDLSYDRFVKFQLAADRYLGAKPTGAREVVEETLPPVQIDPKNAERAADRSTAEDLAALGFLGLGPKYYNRDKLDVMADEWEDRVDTMSRAFLGLTVSCARCHDHKFDPITAKDYYALAGVFASTKMINRMPDGMAEKPGVQAKQLNPGTVHVVEDGTPTDLNVFIRGNVESKGPVVPRRFLRVLCSTEPPPFKEGSGRKELAEAIASADNPLTARVLVNRVWGQFFGQPLVSTPSNFGHRGSKPSHPELLDDLAVRFIEQGWSVKSLVREIVLSSTYRQSTATDVHKARIDAANTLLWHMNRRRMTVEQWRDSVLFVSGELRWDGTGSADLDDEANLRRTVCARISRLRLNDMLAQFDYPDANVHSERRSVTTTPIQKLFMLNSPFMLARAKALAARLTAKPQEDDSVCVQNGYRLLFSRSPDSAELQLALAFLRKPASGGMSRWEQYAQILLASNEMLYVD